MDSDLVTIRVFSSESEAMVAQAALQAFGIDCITHSDDCGHLRPSLTMANGIRLDVRTGDAAQALEVLNNVPEPAGSVQ